MAELKEYALMASSDVFVRKASGLVREVGLLSGIGLNITTGSTIAAPYVLLPYFIMFATGGNLLLSFVIAALASAAISSIYAHFVAAMPRSGGEYVFLGRTVHPLLGFVVNWIMAALFVFWIVFSLFWFVDMGKQLAFNIAPSLSLGWMDIFQGNLGTFLFMAVIMTILTFVAVLGMKVYNWVQKVIWIPSFIALGIVLVASFAAMGHFPQLFNSWAVQYVPGVPDMYNKIISDAAAGGYSLVTREGPTMEQTLTFAALMFSYTAPYNVGTSYIAGEVKNAESGIRQHILVEGAVVFYTIFFLIICWTCVNMVGLKFLGSINYLGSVEGLPINVFGWSYWAAIMPKWMAVFCLAMLFVQNCLCDLSYWPIATRCVFAWSFDRLLPTWMCHVSDKWKSPTYTFATLYVLCLVFLGLAIGVNLWGYIAAVGLWTLINLVIVCIAGIVFPYVRRDMFEQMPLKGRVAGIPTLTLISICGLILTLVVSSSYFTNPPFASTLGLSTVTLGSSILIYAMPIAIFFVARAYWKRKGIDLDLAFRQIPPA